MERCILALTNEGGWILAPYAGVGSAAIAALKNRRNAVAIEKDIKITEDRLEQLKNGSLKIRPIGKPVHKPSPNDKVAKMPSGWLN